MALLLNYSQQQNTKPISANNEEKYFQIASEVEEYELKTLLGVLLLQDLQASPTSAWNLKLLNGDALLDGSNHKGLRYVIAYLNYSRYVGFGYLKDTFTGIKKQKNEESDFATEGEIKRIQQLNREIALTEFELIKTYLNENSTNFPKWLSATEKKLYTPRIYGIRKTAK